MDDVKKDDCEDSTMLTCKTKPKNQHEFGAGNGDVRASLAMRLLLCAGGLLAGWHALRYLGRRLSASACLAAGQRALRDSTSDRRSAARWENEGGAMQTGHYGGPLHPE
ncbi:hypothetical protein [Polaromonas sp. CG_9.11]|uniref:hypothetical protein n=1 Tax=Polaromonas sp. CG_9.11 TaxID=2787730 RepID=UPI0018C99DFF|nr:hypothetical protein [Polaromonas sp. CG_9.11]MBG6078173.1 hypothetical protein [Polaromonas sp. CG_9.11]